MSQAHRSTWSPFVGLVLVSIASAHDGDPKIRDKQPAYAGHGWRNAQRIAGVSTSGGGSGSAAVMQPPVAFPSNDVTLLSWLTLADFGVGTSGNGNSCYGYVAPSGREYAIFAHSNGTAFVEVTQPGNAQLVAQIPGPVSLWRDVKTYSTYCYAVSEGGGGIQVMNLASIDSGVVTLVNTINDDATSATHTLAVDPVSGFLYRSGGGASGLRIYDVHTNPANPTRVGSWNPIYVHEPSIVTYTSGPAAGKQIAYCCGGLDTGFTNTGLYVVDVTNKASPVQQSSTFYANAGYCHQAWPSPDKQFLYLDDELDDENLGVTSVTRVFSLANPLAPSFLGTFTTGSTAIDHNQYTRGDRIYQSNYRSGLHVWQTSAPGTPTSPVEIASFDTWPEDDATLFNGLWNNYPYLPSGVVIGSDIEKGLFVWWVGAPQVAFAEPSPLAFVHASGETLRVQITGAIQPGSAMLHYDVGAGVVDVALTQAPDASWFAALPATPCGTKVEYWYSAISPNGIVWTDPEGASTQVHTLLSGSSSSTPVDEAFEAANAAWTVGAPGDAATSGVWTRVNPNGTTAAPEDDHSSPGTMCWVTGQGSVGGQTGSADVDGGATTLTSPAFDLSAFGNATVSYWRWYDDNDNTSAIDDAFTIDVSSNNGASWVNVETIGPGPQQIGIEGGWFFHEFAVKDFVPMSSQVKVRFVASDTGNGSIVEAAIDDFRVRAVTCTGFATFCAGDGTQVACPCGNTGASGAGCASSTFSNGATLAGSGTARVSADSAVLSAARMTGTSCVFFQGDASMPPVVVDDGLGCVTGSVVRLGTKPVVSATSAYPQAGDASISVRGLVPPAGATRYYQCFYRNAAAAFCPPATSNRTNGVAVVWAP